MNTAHVSTSYLRSKTLRPSSRLSFRPLTLADIPAVEALLKQSTSRTCDYSIGGIFMWTDYFDYQFCIVDDTLFISGVSEDDLTSRAFALPVGRLPLARSIAMLREYCREQKIPLRFSAVPEDRLDELKAVGNWTIRPLVDWSDYLYNIIDLATLTGKRYNKKRNHVNRFMTDNPEASLVDLGPEDVGLLIKVFDSWGYDPDSPTARQERDMTLNVLRNLDRYPFEGAMLTDGRGHIVAFTLAEIIGDTMYDHIEKMDHTVAGAGETINRLFAERMLARHPQLRYINREEDCGDPSLRFAKESYHPAAMLRKFDLIESF